MHATDTDGRFPTPTTRRTIVRTGAKLAYAAPLVATSLTLSAMNVAATHSPGHVACETFVCGNPRGLCTEPGSLDVCACFELTEDPGNGRCLGDFPCSSDSACNTTADCPSGSTCVTNTCCGLGVQLCAPACPAPTDSRSRRPPDEVSGLTAAGQ